MKYSWIVIFVLLNLFSLNFSAAQEAPATTKWVVKKGDTLSTISVKVFGTNKRWREIRDLNKDVIKNDSLEVGMELTVPASAATETETAKTKVETPTAPVPVAKSAPVPTAKPIAKAETDPVCRPCEAADSDDEGGPFSYESRFAYLIGGGSYGLSGTGFTATTSNINSSAFAFELLRSNNKSAARIGFQSTRANVGTPSTLSPNQVVELKTHAYVQFDKNWGGSAKQGNTQFYSGIGLEIRGRDVNESTPNPILASSNRAGFRFASGFVYPISSMYFWETDFSIGVPIYQDEYKSKTGFMSYSLTPELHTNIVYKVSHFIDFSVGVVLSAEWTSFSGTGSRGTTDGRELFTNYSVPFELRFQF